jgi:D-arabinose 1-dehydrogenase-like Zn-dependent alcohol dehydrogenase
MSNRLSNAATFPAKRQMTEEKITMKAIVVTDQAAGTAGMKLVERPEPQAAINDVVVEVHASGFVPTELEWPSTWTDRRDRDRTPSIPGHELAGVVTALGYGTTGLSVGQRVFALADWHRDGSLAEYVAMEARNLAPLPGDVDFTVGASLPISGLTAWQGLFQHGRLQAGQSVLAHGAAGAVGSMVTQLAREAGAYVIGAGRVADRQKALSAATNAGREHQSLWGDKRPALSACTRHPDLWRDGTAGTRPPSPAPRVRCHDQACGPLLDVTADDIEHQIDFADVFQGVVVEVDELLRAEVKRCASWRRAYARRQSR